MIDSIELFCGAGGLALGLQKAGINHKALFEWDKYSCANINQNIADGNTLVSDWKVFETDVRKVDFQVYKGAIDVISGGPPCQPFSLGGKAKAYNDTRDMWPEAIRAVREVLPQAFVFENVKGLLRPALLDLNQSGILSLMGLEIMILVVGVKVKFNPRGICCIQGDHGQKNSLRVQKIKILYDV